MQQIISFFLTLLSLSIILFILSAQHPLPRRTPIDNYCHSSRDYGFRSTTERMHFKTATSWPVWFRIQSSAPSTILHINIDVQTNHILKPQHSVLLRILITLQMIRGNSHTKINPFLSSIALYISIQTHRSLTKSYVSRVKYGLICWWSLLNKVYSAS